MSNSLVPARVTGAPGDWCRDFAVVGAASGLFGPGGVVLVYPPFTIVAAVVGALLGAGLGWALPHALEGVRGRVPLPVLGALAVPLGAVWGGLTGGFAGAFTANLEVAWIGAFFAALAGALQLGWLWLPYTVLAVLRLPTWPAVALAAVAPLLAWAAVMFLAVV